MTARFAASSIDLSDLPTPEVIRDLSFDAILAARLSSLKGRMEDAGLEWDVSGMLTDPLAIAEREDAFRELLGLARINDAAKSRMLAFATGGDLDHIAADRGIFRRVIRPATSDSEAVRESDRELRRRVQVAPEAFTTTGSAGSYEHHAKEASAEVFGVGLVRPRLGRIDVILLARDADGGPSEDARLAVRARLLDKAVGAIAAEVTVRGATPVAYQIRLTLVIPAGPDPATIVAEARRSIRKLIEDRRAIGAAMPRSAITAAAHVGGVERVDLAEPAADLTPAGDEVASCSSIVVDWELSNG